MPSSGYLLRISLMVSVVMACVLGWSGQASTIWSQEVVGGAAAVVDAEPDIDNAAVAPGPREFMRPTGGFLSIFKLIPLLIIFLIWVFFADWVNRDADYSKMPHVPWNMIVVFPMSIAVILALVIPFFAVGIILTSLALLVPMIVFVTQRNAKVHSDDKVLTAAHISAVMSGTSQKRSGKEGETEGKGPPIGLVPMGAEQDLLNKSNLLLAKQSPGYVVAREVLFDAIKRHADKIILDYTSEIVSVRMEIDGVWHDAGNRDRETADPMLVVLKKISNLNTDDRRSRQKGNFGTSYRGRKQTWNFGSQGTKTGERAVLQLRTKIGSNLSTLEDLGMRPKLIETVKRLLKMKSGILVFSSMPSGGLSATLSAALVAADRYTRHIITFEDESHVEVDIDNIDVNTFRGADDNSPVAELVKLFRTEPDAMVVPDFHGAEVLEFLCDQVNKHSKLIIGTVRAKEAPEALLRMLAYKASTEKIAPAIQAVVNQRLIRKLCEYCKEAYNPSPELVKKLGLPTQRIDTFYREPQNRTEEDEVCGKCGGIGYRGRTAIFEVLVMNDAIRGALVKQPKIDVLRKLAQESGNRTLQEEGIVLVARGITSLSELQRILKQ